MYEYPPILQGSEQQQLLALLDDDVGLHRLPHDLVVGDARLFHILNRVFHNFAC